MYRVLWCFGPSGMRRRRGNCELGVGTLRGLQWRLSNLTKWAPRERLLVTEQRYTCMNTQRMNEKLRSHVHSAWSNTVPSDAIVLHQPPSQRMRLRRVCTRLSHEQRNLEWAAAVRAVRKWQPTSKEHLRFAVFVQVHLKCGDDFSDLQWRDLL